MEVVLRGWIAAALAGLGLGGCQSWEVTEVDGLTVFEMTRRSNSRGRVPFRINAPAGSTAMLMTALPPEGDLAAFESLKTPNNELVFDGDEEWAGGLNKTGARYAVSVNSLNWPIVEEDAPMRAGSWSGKVGVIRSDFVYQSRTELPLVAAFKDTPLGGGDLVISMVYSGSTAEDSDLREAVGDAVDRWQELYDPLNITVDVREFTASFESMPAPGEGDASKYVTISESVDPWSVPVVLVPEIEGGVAVYGRAGSIPGALVPSRRSAVVVSATASAGDDLVFSSEERRILGETFAHEVGHYLGLFHPVEPPREDDPGWQTWDALADTDQCDSRQDCEAALRSNLMFPYPVCSETSCIPQDEFTADQTFVTHTYVGVR